MKNIKLAAVGIGFGVNFALFAVKLYIGISTASLTIYCDAINNLGDTLACVVGFIGFMLIKKLGEKPSERAQSLMTFVISIFIAATGIYFVYNGLGRLMYPIPVNFSTKYAIALTSTIIVKIVLGIIFYRSDKRDSSPVLKAFLLDSFLDCFITLSALMSLFLVSKLNYAVDGAFAVITGSIITASAIKNLIKETKNLVFD